MRLFLTILLSLLLLPVVSFGQHVAQVAQNEDPAAENAETAEEETKAKDEAAEEDKEAEAEAAEEAEAEAEAEAAAVEEEEEEETEIEAREEMKEPPLVEDLFEDLPVEEGKEEEEIAGPKKITIDTVVYVDYQFFDTTDAFKVKYHINMGGTANIATAIIKGQAEVATEVTGYLAKWPEGQCILDVSIAKVPYEISYRQTGGDEADINIQFKKDIMEKWDSTCTFIGGTFKPFKTEGPAEKWIADALEKTSPPIGSIVAPLEAGEATKTTFDITEYTVIEENLGSAKVKGTGIITIQPVAKAAPTMDRKAAPTANRGRS